MTALVSLAGLTGLAGCSSADASEDRPRLKVTGAFMPQPVGDMASGFLTVTNSGGAPDRLTSVTSDVADDVTIHETVDRRMRQVASFDVPADGELRLERGGSHLMFMGLKKSPKVGGQVSVELRFEKTGPIEVDLPVKEPTYHPTRH
ncbi:copper chaperone PCu(A)C [Streptomyces sp. NBC_01498]|nr:copper chaperone PCu(A)C [Streptomyces sp. NBC_01498]WTL28837.1 copper chaperone PCu(A)C [Streptomyces sp. NBC_01498]